jgi:hypothetical protein
MKHLFLLLLICTACGKQSSSSKKPAPPVIDPPVVVIDPPILEPEITKVQNLWKNDNQSSVLQYLDLRELQVGSIQSADVIISCNGSLGNAGLVNDVPEDSIGSSGDDLAGFIQIGHTKYVGATENYAACRAVSKEKYGFTIVGQTLLLQNLGWCSSHACPNDGIEVFQLEE